MRRRFILIDQSVKGPGGHHYEYDGRILDAAREQGFETLLLAHRSYRGQIAHPVQPAFSLTFWDNYSYYYAGPGRPKLPTFLLSFVEFMHRFRLALKRRFVYSRFGLALARARHVSLRNILLRPHLPEDASFTTTARPLLAIARVVVLIQPAVRRVGTVFAPLRRKRFWRLAALLVASPLLAAAGIVHWSRGRQRDPAVRFADGLIGSVEGHSTSDRAVIFVPNATPAELEGLIRAARADHPIAKAHWVFLFRRPIFSGYPGSYKRQMELVRRHRIELARLHMLAPGVDAHFYTDTDELTQQYNLLGIVPFRTLPVPVDPVPVVPQHGDLITLGYLGDARDEKGFQHLPRLVDYLSPRSGESPKIRFLLQANFNVPEGEPGSRYARGLLQHHDAGLVELVYGPFDSAEYNALLSRMDVILIPYAAENYSSRSSGVLMEAFAIGRPVLIPACSWMAGLVEPARRRHLQSVVQDMQPLAVIVPPADKLEAGSCPVDRSADHVLFRLKFDDGFSGYVRILIASFNEFGIELESRRMGYKAIDNEVFALLPKRPSARLRWKIELVEAEPGARILASEMKLFRAGRLLPLGAGAAMFDREEDLPAAARELIEFHPHHLAAAAALREELRPLYDPAVLVQILSRDLLGSTGSPAAVRERTVA